MTVRLLSGAFLSVATILAAVMLAPQAQAEPQEPCNADAVANVRHEGGKKWICYSYGGGRYGWVVQG